MHDIAALRAAMPPIRRAISDLEAVRANRPEAKARIVEQVNHLHAVGTELLRSNVARLQHGGSLDLAAVGLQFRPHMLERYGLDLAPILVAVLGVKRFTEALTTHLDTVDDGPGAAERLEQVTILRARLRHLEVAEEVQIVESERTGAPVPRRADADPEVVLMSEASLAAAYGVAVDALASESFV